jgi:hypothetical protein
MSEIRLSSLLTMVLTIAALMVGQTARADEYTIRWVNYDGTMLEEKQVASDFR